VKGRGSFRRRDVSGWNKVRGKVPG
jgi:hypothetical protein